MSGLRIATNELRRLSTGTLPKLALAALVLVPLLYASFYLYANYDPYSNLDQLPAAIVSEDTGADDAEGEHHDLGSQVTDELLDSDSFQWHEVDADEAEQGVRDGDYAFAVTIPKGFSAALLSTGEFEPQQATITLTTNDANNYLAGQIGDTLGDEIRDTIAEQVGNEAANRFLVGFATIHDSLETAHGGAKKLTAGAGKLVDGQQQLVDGTGELDNGSSELADGLGTLRERTAALPEQTEKLADGAQQVADGNEKLATIGSEVADRSTQLQDALDDVDGELADRLQDNGLSDDEVDAALDAIGAVREPVDTADDRIQQETDKLAQLSSGADEVAGGAQRLADAAPQLANGVSSASDGADELSQGAETLDDGQGDALSGAKTLHNGAANLRDGLAEGLAEIPDPDEDTRQETAGTIADPVAVHSSGMASAGTYGAGLAPFFIGLATWIGAFVLFLLLRPLSERSITSGAAPFRVAFGGWLAAAALGAAQIVVLFAAVTWLVGIDVAHPFAAIGFVLLTSVTFTAIVQALNALFGAVGKFLALVLLVLQLVSAGGTFPWQTLPEPLHPLHAVLPMGYVVDGLRHLLYSGASLEVLADVGVLAAYLVISIAATTYAAHRHRRWTVSRLKPELAL